jgi:ABC-type transport system involved in multi-copper enzyme maturation permease subunit
MPIREKGYYNWEGELKTAQIKWLPIFLNGIKGVYKKRFAKLLFSSCTVYSIIFLLLIYLAVKLDMPAAKLPPMVKEVMDSSNLFFHFYTFGFIQIFFMMILSLFTGTDLISGDLKLKSLSLYFSRPISHFDYLKGKFFIVLFYLLTFTLVPAVLLIIFKMIFTGGFTVPLKVILGVMIYPVVVYMFMASLIILISSISPNRKFVVILFIIFNLMSVTVAEILHGIFREDGFLFISIWRNMLQFGQFLFGRTAGFYSNGMISGCILVGLFFLFSILVTNRIKKVEV